MASNSSDSFAKKKRPRQGFRYQMEFSFPDDDSKKAFLNRLDCAKRMFKEKMKKSSIDNVDLMSCLLDLVQSSLSSSSGADVDTSRAVKPMLKNSGVFTSGDQGGSLFVCEQYTLDELIKGLSKKCECGRANRTVSQIKQIGHIVRVEFVCRDCKRRQWWASSRVFGSRYLINQKVVHAFTCAGILPSQYLHFSDFAGMGIIGKRYMKSVYTKKGYIEVVSRCTDLSMARAIDDVKACPEYQKNGEWVITDARHDSTANAYHSTVPCLSGSNHMIVGCVTLSRKEHSCAQTRELACTRIVLPNVIAKGLNVVEVAHDNSSSVKGYITQELKLVNSYDTWHGTKNVAKGLKTIAVGAAKRAGVTWFPELSDKRKSTKTHLYYCMKNCGEDPSRLRNSIDNIVNHYKGKHSSCHEDSPCRRQNYLPTKVILKSEGAIAAYTKKLRGTLIYANVESYCRCHDTFWVESFNHHLLTYIPKRIHFGTATFHMRMNFACMDWNENVGRPYTSERFIQDMRRPDRHTAFKVLVFHFVEDIWSLYMSRNVVDISPVEDTEELEMMEVDDDIVAMEDDDLLEDGVDVDDDVVEEDD